MEDYIRFVKLEDTKEILDIYSHYISNGKIIGYAYAGKYRERFAYRFDVETSIYTDKDKKIKGVGKALYKVLLEMLKELGYYNVYAIITVPNPKSIKIHDEFGFKELSRYYNTGYKHNKWRDVVVLGKNIIPYTDNPSEPKQIDELKIKYKGIY